MCAGSCLISVCAYVRVGIDSILQLPGLEPQITHFQGKGVELHTYFFFLLTPDRLIFSFRVVLFSCQRPAQKYGKEEIPLRPNKTFYLNCLPLACVH